jgi:hypothetical protein
LRLFVYYKVYPTLLPYHSLFFHFAQTQQAGNAGAGQLVRQSGSRA